MRCAKPRSGTCAGRLQPGLLYNGVHCFASSRGGQSFCARRFQSGLCLKSWRCSTMACTDATLMIHTHTHTYISTVAMSMSKRLVLSPLPSSRRAMSQALAGEHSAGVNRNTILVFVEATSHFCHPAACADDAGPVLLLSWEASLRNS
eukprot:1191812-Amphidinium_carterae.1